MGVCLCIQLALAHALIVNLYMFHTVLLAILLLCI